MTGFGRGEKGIGNDRLIVEARGENHRFFDARIHLPEGLGSLESDILKRLKKLVLRGKVKITVSCETTGVPTPQIDLRVASAAHESLKKLKKTLGVKGDITLDQMLSFGDFIKVFPKERSLGGKNVHQIGNVVASAIERLDESRSREGKRLQKDLTLRISKCKRVLQKIKTARGKYETEIKRRLEEKTKSLIKGKDMDEAKLYSEIAAISERGDITEELVRMNSHLLQFSEFLSKSNVSVGRELDFLTQEMNREVGTISAKSKSPDISRLTIGLRSEIEKIREQSQNVE